MLVWLARASILRLDQISVCGEAWVESSHAELASIFDKVLQTRPPGCAWAGGHQKYFDDYIDG